MTNIYSEILSFGALLRLDAFFEHAFSSSSFIPRFSAAPAGDTNMIGGVGSLYAAAMQTAGVYAQARVLELFQTALGRIAALCYLASILGALVSTAAFGTYRKAGYLLIGPALFYYVTTVLTSTDGAHLQYGNREIAGSVPQQIRFLQRWVTSSNYSQAAQVSFVFLGFDALVSNVIQGITDQLENTQAKEDIILRTRERVFSWLLHAMPEEQAFVKLLAFGNHGECAQLTTMLVSMHNEYTHDSDIGPLQTAVLTPRGRWLQQQYNLKAPITRVRLDEQSLTLIRAHPRLQGETITENPTCQQVWRWTSQVALGIAENRLRAQAFSNGAPIDSNIPWATIIAQCRQALEGATDPGATQRTRAEDVLAAYIIRNTLNLTPLNRMTQEVFSRQPFNPDQQRFILETQAGAEAYGAYMKILYFATAIPYIQGFLLYILAMLFPFFAIFLVMPSRATSFLLWFALWTWVKSWDIGFAMVDVARKVLWPFVAFGTNRFREQLDWNRPETVYNLISMNDPFAIHNTYLQFTAFLTCSVPFVTAHFCLGASHMVDFVKMTVDQNATKFGDHRARGMRRELVQTPAEQMLYQRADAAGLIRAQAATTRYAAAQSLRNFLNRNRSDNNGRPAGEQMGPPNPNAPADRTITPGAPNAPGNAGNGNLPPPGGDFTLQEIQRQAYQLGYSNYMQSDEARGLQTRLAVSSGRLSFFNYGVGWQQTTTAIDDFNSRNFIGVGPGGNNRVTSYNGNAPAIGANGYGPTDVFNPNTGGDR